MSPFKLISLENGYLTLSAMFQLSWADSNLQWDPSAYGGATQVILPSGTVWKPDFTIWNE